MRVKAASVLGYLKRREHQLWEMLYLTLLLAVRSCDLEIRNKWIIIYLNEGRSLLDAKAVSTMRSIALEDAMLLG
jgi:hypothetical protein